MQPLTIGITKAGTGLDGIVWNILGQTYVPKQLSEHSFAWHATFPPGTFVPPHIHPTQEEYIYMFEGRLDALLDGKDYVANAGDLLRLPMGIPHGLFNKSDQPSGVPGCVGASWVPTCCGTSAAARVESSTSWTR